MSRDGFTGYGSLLREPEAGLQSNVNAGPAIKPAPSTVQAGLIQSPGVPGPISVIRIRHIMEYYYGPRIDANLKDNFSKTQQSHEFT